MNIGELAALISAVASLGALSAAIAAALQTKKLFGIESGRDQIAEAERRQLQAERNRQQASCISAWVLLRKVPNDPERAFLVIAARNASELPIYALRLAVFDSSGREIVAEQVAVLPPEDTPLELPQVALCDYRFASDAASMQALAVQLTFLDASGRAWCRDVRGVLEEPASGALQASLPASSAKLSRAPDPKTNVQVKQLE
jgi:hypothetical protein